MNNRIIIVLTGAPGSGKGYLCDVLVKNLKTITPSVSIISTGDMIRAEVKKESELGKKIKGIMEAGQLVSDDIIGALVEKNLKENRSRIIIFDGYPRTSNQAIMFGKTMKFDDFIYVIHRETPTELILQRVNNRRVCEKCGKVQTAERPDCVDCHGNLIVRKDDAVIDQRLKVYEDETLPAIDILADMFNFVEIDGKEDAEESVVWLMNHTLHLLPKHIARMEEIEKKEDED